MDKNENRICSCCGHFPNLLGYRGVRLPEACEYTISDQQISDFHFEITTRRDECLNQLPFVSFPLFLHSLGNVLLFAEHVHIAKGKQLLRRVQRIQGMRHRRCQYGKACFLLC